MSYSEVELKSLQLKKNALRETHIFHIRVKLKSILMVRCICIVSEAERSSQPIKREIPPRCTFPLA